MPETPADKRYWAFISYSHADEAWAQWLHRSLETYRVPRHLVGRALGDEKIPRRLFPVFRDRDELPSSHELGAVINRALAASRTLVVICSPRSAGSRWVNEEIKAFRALGRSDRIFCLIVDGEPHASEKPGIAFSECFPPALRTPGFEPIAADARERKDGKASARLKLLAGLLGVGFDELKQREKQRQRRQLLLNVAAGLALAAVLGGTVQWFLAQRADREREIRVEQLVESGRLELLDGHQARAAVYLNEARKLGDDSVPVRFMLGQAMQPVEALTGVQVRHGGERVYGAAFSPDGSRFVLIVSPRENVATAQVYDAGTGTELAEYENAPPIPRAIEYLPGGALLVTGYSDTDYHRPVTRVWSPRHGASPAIDLDGFNGIAGLAVSPDGARVLTAGAAGVRIHDVRSGIVVREFKIAGGATAASFSPDGHSIASAASDGTVSLHDVAGPGTTRSLPELKGLKVVGVTFTPDGSRLVALSSAGDIRIWTRAGNLQLSFGDPEEIYQVAFDRSGRRLLTTGLEGFKVWSLVRGSLLLSRQVPLLRAARALLSPDGNTAYFCDVLGAVVEAWDVLGKRKLFSLDHHTASVTTLALDADGGRLLLASADGRAETWRTRIRPHWEYQSFDDYPYIAHFEPDETRIIVGRGTHARGDAIRLDAASGERLGVVATHGAVVTDVDVSADGTRIATASADGHAALWNADGSRITDLLHEPFAVTGVRFDVTGTRLLTTGRDSGAQRDVARLWSVPDGAPIASFDHVLGIPQVRYDRSAHFDVNGGRVLTQGSDRSLKIWSARDGALLREIPAHDATVVSAEFSPDGTRVLSAGLDNRVRIWDAVTGGMLAELADPALGQPTRAIWSPSADLIAISSRNGAVTLWNPVTAEHRTLKGHSQWVVAPVFLHGGAVLLSYGFDGTVMAWDTVTARSLGTAGAAIGELLSAETDRNDSRLVTSAWGQIGMWDLALESRPAVALDRRLACLTPWRLDDTTLTLRQAELSSACAATAQ